MLKHLYTLLAVAGLGAILAGCTPAEAPADESNEGARLETPEEPATTSSTESSETASGSESASQGEATTVATKDTVLKVPGMT